MAALWDVLLDGQVVVPGARPVVTRLGQLRGLMFSPPRALVFDLGREKPVWMHMMFVFRPIDVVLLDEKLGVVAVKPGFKPFTVYVPGVRARYILELGAGTVKRLALGVGSRLGLRQGPAP